MYRSLYFPQKWQQNLSVFSSQSAHRISQILFRTCQKLYGVKQEVFQTSWGEMAYWASHARQRPALVYLHGFGDRKEGFLPALGFFFRRFRVLAPDLPGFGESFHNEAFTYNIDGYTQLLLQWLEELGIHQFHLMGNSLGGGLALGMALQAPERVLSVSALAPGGVIPKQRQSLYNELLAGGNPWNISDKRHFEEFIRRVVHRPVYIPWPLKQQIYESFKLNSQWYQYLLGDFVGDYDTCAALAESPNVLNQHLGGIRSPTQIVWGRQDSFFPFEIGLYMHQEIPDSELQLFDNCGHCPQLEMPRKLAVVHREFVESLS